MMEIWEWEAPTEKGTLKLVRKISHSCAPSPQELGFPHFSYDATEPQISSLYTELNTLDSTVCT